MTDIVKANDIYGIMERVIADGDLSKLTPKQRVEYYNKTCEALGLNPLTRPFEYQRFNGKVILYARKECTEQLRCLHKVSITALQKEILNDCYVVTAYAKTADGKEDVGTGAVTISGLKGEALSNAMMKAETKAKRRVTLSICGLGFTDESEIHSIPNSEPVHIDHNTGELIEEIPAHAKRSLATPLTPKITKDENVMADIAPPRAELVEAVATAKNLTELKNAFSRAYRIHAGNLETMQDIVKLKDIRIKQIELYQHECSEIQLHGNTPTLPYRAQLGEE